MGKLFEDLEESYHYEFPNMVVKANDPKLKQSNF